MSNSGSGRLFDALHAAAIDSEFSGVIRVDEGGALVDQGAYGWADRAHRVPVSVSQRFGVASISKGFTALVIGSLLDEGLLTLTDAVRPILGDDLPLIDQQVTIGHLLAHTSGIGDYLDENGEGEITDYVLPVPVHELESTAAFLPLLDGRPQVSAPGTVFAYNNSGFVVLAVIAERVAGSSFAELAGERVFRPAGMSDSDYLRTDELPGDVARGYLFDGGLRTNALHLPVRGSGDGGAFTTVEDLSSFWSALVDHQIVSSYTCETLLEPVSDVPADGMRYGRGFWRGRHSSTILLEGYDAGVSGRTWYDPETHIAASVISNTSEGAWPVLRAIAWS